MQASEMVARWAGERGGKVGKVSKDTKERLGGGSSQEGWLPEDQGGGMGDGQPLKGTSRSRFTLFQPHV